MYQISQNNSYKIIVYALEYEFESIFFYITNNISKLDKGIYFYQEKNIIFLKCGIKAKYFSKNINKILENNLNISKIINIGYAGSLSDNLKLYHLYEIDTVINYKNDKNIVLNEKNNPIILYTSDIPITQQTKKEKLIKKNVSLVDMEGYFIAEFCLKNNINIKIYKIISDFGVNISINSFKTILKNNQIDYSFILDN